MPDKNTEARYLAQKHYEIEQGMASIYRLNAAGDSESNPSEPIKLLEVYLNTIASGIMPLQFGPSPAAGVHYPSVILEITPEEFAQIERQELTLPFGWTIGERFPKPVFADE